MSIRADYETTGKVLDPVNPMLGPEIRDLISEVLKSASSSLFLSPDLIVGFTLEIINILRRNFIKKEVDRQVTEKQEELMKILEAKEEVYLKTIERLSNLRHEYDNDDCTR